MAGAVTWVSNRSTKISKILNFSIFILVFLSMHKANFPQYFMTIKSCNLTLSSKSIITLWAERRDFFSEIDYRNAAHEIMKISNWLIINSDVWYLWLECASLFLSINLLEWFNAIIVAIHFWASRLNFHVQFFFTIIKHLLVFFLLSTQMVADDAGVVAIAVYEHKTRFIDRNVASSLLFLKRNLRLLNCFQHPHVVSYRCPCTLDNNIRSRISPRLVSRASDTALIS